MSMPEDKALEMIKEKLVQDGTLKDRPPLAPQDIINFLVMCLKCTYFHFQCEYYIQISGEAMGSCLSYHVQFVQRALWEAALDTVAHLSRW